MWQDAACEQLAAAEIEGYFINVDAAVNDE